MRPLVLCVLSCVFACDCAPSHGDDESDPAKRFCIALYRGWYAQEHFDARRERCVPTEGPRLFEDEPAFEGAMTAIEEVCVPGDRFHDLLAAEVRAGAILSTDALATCLDRVRAVRATRSPDLWTRAPLEAAFEDPACRDAWRAPAPLAAGATCTSNEQCESGLICVAMPATSTTFLCGAPAALGEACGAAHRCADELHCEDHTCALRLQAGAACTTDAQCAQGLGCRSGSCGSPGGEGAPCDDTLPCAEALSCGGPEGARTCHVAARAGESCAATRCEDTCLVCRSTAAGAPPICTVRGETGSTCAFDRDCVFAARCVAGICAARGAEGAACDSSEGACAVGFACVDGHCARRGALGEECSAEEPCDADLRCDGICKLPGRLGAACVGTGGCDEGRCLEGACTAVAAGATCVRSQDCAAGLTCEGTEARTCEKPPEHAPSGAPGDPCETNDDCGSQDCLPEKRCATTAPGGEGCRAFLDLRGLLVFAALGMRRSFFF